MGKLPQQRCRDRTQHLVQAALPLDPAALHDLHEVGFCMFKALVWAGVQLPKISNYYCLQPCYLGNTNTLIQNGVKTYK